MGRNNRWQEIWEKKGLAPKPDGQPSTALQDLIATDGFNTGFGDIRTDAWIRFIDGIRRTFDLEAGDSAFEVGCGAGAFLYPLYQAGLSVGGVDYSPALVQTAAQMMPEGEFIVQDASSIDMANPVDVTLAFSVFIYFDGLEYARSVIGRMCAKATRGVAILDLADAATASEALANRQEMIGGAAAYAERYDGLEHQSYSRDWIRTILEEFDMSDVRIESQDIDGYGNGRYRFNAIAYKN